MAVAIIPARGGSKRIPRKNLRDFHGRPMIGWSIEAALGSGCFERVLVSTEDDAIARVAEREGAEVPFRRPPDLANDYAATVDVMQHAVNWLAGVGERPATVCCLYATAPFVTAAALAEGQSLLNSGDWDYVFTATEFEYPIQRALKHLPGGGVAFFQPQYAASRSQDLEPVCHDAGQFYWGRSEAFAQRRPLLGEYSRPLMLPRTAVQDIDTEGDWRLAEALFALQQGSRP